jgi:AraC family transcriptional regulator, regulatory protein of adaptative response / methylated-DNA-[protein]-cysteine methyltransferase
MDIRHTDSMLPPKEEMLRACTERDASYDGLFFLAVRTTGIFCRPSCPARNPLAENAEYFASARAALFAGYRPCKRCNPLEAHGEQPEWVQSLLAVVEAEPDVRITDHDLRTRGLVPATVRRHFLREFGLTFHAYARGRRLGQSLHAIRQGNPLDDVILSHGFESHSGFRDAFRRTFGRPPGGSRDADCIVLGWYASPLGPLIIGATATGVCLVEFSERRMLERQFHTLSRRLGLALVPGENEHLNRMRLELEEYFAGRRSTFDVPLLIDGSEFERRVWGALQEIPYGETRSYQAVATAIGSPNAVRAVGRANGMNRIAIVIPCHRVIQKNGTLGGYGGGLWRKQRLLEVEGRTGSLAMWSDAAAAT